MDLKPGFVFKPLPDIRRPLLFSLTSAASKLGPLVDLPGIWKGNGFNMIWRPNNTPGQDRFLELNLTDEQIEFVEIPGEIPNRGLLQADILMFGVRYLQSISDLNNGAGLHIEACGQAGMLKQLDRVAECTSVIFIEGHARIFTRNLA